MNRFLAGVLAVLLFAGAALACAWLIERAQMEPAARVICRYIMYVAMSIILAMHTVYWLMTTSWSRRMAATLPVVAGFLVFAWLYSGPLQLISGSVHPGGVLVFFLLGMVPLCLAGTIWPMYDLARLGLDRRVREGACPACGYDRAGIAQGVVCPECGETAPPPQA